MFMVFIVLLLRLKYVMLDQKGPHCHHGCQRFTIILDVFLYIVTYVGILYEVVFHWKPFNFMFIVVSCILSSSWVMWPCICSIDTSHGGVQPSGYRHAKCLWSRYKAT